MATGGADWPESRSESAPGDDGEAFGDGAAVPALPQPPSEDPRPRGQSNKLMWVVAGVIVVGLPIGVGVVAFKSTPAGANAANAATPDVVAAPAVEPTVLESKSLDPTWLRPAWADEVEEMVAFELPAAADVRLANGRLRPTLGISCAAGRTDIHVVTGGSAPLDPVTSAHVVKLAFDGSPTREERWTASEDQRALMAPDPLKLAMSIAAAHRLELGFTHYMTGAEIVEFDLRGADKIVASMVEPCGWTSE